MLELTWLGTAGFRVKTEEGAVFLIDPFLSRPATARPVLSLQRGDLFPIDEIFLSHGRFDHAMDIPTLVKYTGAIVNAHVDLCKLLIDKNISPHNLSALKLHQPKGIGTLRWQALPARISQIDASHRLQTLLRHPATRGKIDALDKTWPIGGVAAYLFEVDEISFAHFGTSGWLETTLHDLHPKALLLPVERTPDSDDSLIRLAIRLQPQVIVPHHWDDYYPPFTSQVDLNRFQTIIETRLPQCKVYRPLIGQPFSLADIV